LPNNEFAHKLKQINDMATEALQAVVAQSNIIQAYKHGKTSD